MPVFTIPVSIGVDPGVDIEQFRKHIEASLTDVLAQDLPDLLDLDPDEPMPFKFLGAVANLERITRSDRLVELRQGPQSPNFCFDIVDVFTQESVEFVQSDWDWAGLARRLGWKACPECGFTDGTVDCEHKTVNIMLNEAFVWLSDRAGQRFLLTE